VKRGSKTDAKTPQHRHCADAVIPVGGDELWEAVECPESDDEADAPKKPPAEGGRCDCDAPSHLDLLAPDVFTHFAALSSGLLTAREGDSSANNEDDAA
jgi:hypothetical protein